MKKFRALVLLLVAGVLLTLASAAPASAYTATAYDGTQNVANTCNGYQIPPGVVFTGNQIINVWQTADLHNGPYNSVCRQIDGGGWTVADTFRLQQFASYPGQGYDFRALAGTTKWVLCWKYGDTINGWNKWDKIYTADNNGSNERVLGWIWDGDVTQAITWPSCN